ncbi:C-terminal-binding protein [Penicillium malachiteum]|uniref:C-terminal-binding protein n=1 Tax=Penicillium malachiteum TaxID=1324776 RepID=UPI00254671DB|nr:C-terminal-binding protein [Penicillium malachiteum]KAJ5730819.1 C-terminal-binding protein [Penicillium malachiteum]
MGSLDTIIPTYTVIQADGLYPDDSIEQAIFTVKDGEKPFKVNYIQTNLSPAGEPLFKPWSSIDPELRAKVDGITILKPDFTAADLELFPNLKVIVRMGAGYDRVDRVALAKTGVILSNLPDYGTGEIADHAISLALALRRGIILHHDSQRSTPPSLWSHIETPLVSRIQGATFGILGIGLIGTAVALRAKAFGWNVLAYDPYAPNGIEKALGIERTRDIQELFRRSSTLSIHCPATSQTINLVGYDLLQLMPSGSIVVNTARGEVLDLDAAERCLKEGKLTGLGLDVASNEPIPVEGVIHPLFQAYRDQEEWLRGRLVVSLHTAYHSPECLDDIRIKSAQVMRDVFISGLKMNIIAPHNVK